MTGMESRTEDGVRRTDIVPPTPPPSAGVRLEVAILDADREVDRHTSGAELEASDERDSRRAVLVVAAELDLRRYVRECLRGYAEVLVLEADSVIAAIIVAERESPALLVVDERAGGIIGALPWLPAILLADEEPRATMPNARLRFVARPFSAERLLAEVEQLLR